MSETKQKVNTFLVNYSCDFCEEGLVLSRGIALMSYPARYPHKCNVCAEEYIFKCHYPKYEQEVVDE